MRKMKLLLFFQDKIEIKWKANGDLSQSLLLLMFLRRKRPQEKFPIEDVAHLKLIISHYFSL